MSRPAARDGWRTAVRVVGTLATAALLVYLLSRQGWGDIVEAFRRIGLVRVLLAAVLILASRVVVAGRWHVLLRGAGAATTWWQSLELTFAGLFASNFLPTTIGGDVVRLAGAFRIDLDRATCAASLVADRLVGVAGMLVPLPVGLLALWGRATHGAALPVQAAVGLPLGRWVGQAWERGLGLARRGLRAGRLWFRNPASLARALLLSWLHMLCLFSAIWVLLHAMGETISFGLVAGLWTLVYFVTLLPFSVNGLGLQEVSLTFVYTTLGGVSLQSGLTLAVLLRTLYMAASLPGVVFLPALLPSVRGAASDRRPAGPRGT